MHLCKCVLSHCSLLSTESHIHYTVDVTQHKGDDESKRRTKTNDDTVCVLCFLHLSNEIMFILRFLQHVILCRNCHSSCQFELILVTSYIMDCLSNLRDYLDEGPSLDTFPPLTNHQLG